MNVKKKRKKKKKNERSQFTAHTVIAMCFVQFYRHFLRILLLCVYNMKMVCLINISPFDIEFHWID